MPFISSKTIEFGDKKLIAAEKNERRQSHHSTRFFGLRIFLIPLPQIHKSIYYIFQELLQARSA